LLKENPNLRGGLGCGYSELDCISTYVLKNALKSLCGRWNA